MIHLHVHTDGSTLDGEINIKGYVEKVVESGEEYAGISDHGNMINALLFQYECLKNNIKPIFGCEFYIGEPGSKERFHIMLIAKNNKGLENLYKLNAYAYMDNFYSKPRISWSKLIVCSEGLICTTACMGSEFADAYFKTGALEALDMLERYKGLFQDDFYIELQSNYIQEQKKYNKAMCEMATNLGIRHIITTDAHYIKQEDSNTHDTMLCMQVKKKKNDEGRFRFSSNDFFLQNEYEIAQRMNYLHPDQISEGMNNVKLLCMKCTARIKTNQNLLPKLPGLEEEANKVLARHCNVGYVKRFGNRNIPEITERIKFELRVIKEKGYSDYFLIVEDFINYAKERGIYVGGGRGSACGSEVAFVLGITEIEPIKHGLLFERFLNPERMSAPDIDTDYDYERREEVISYVKEKYGVKNVARIIAKGRLTAKAVCRKVLSVHDVDQRLITQITKTIPADLGITLEKAYDTSPEFNAHMNLREDLYKQMLQLEDMIDHVSTHAAGIVITPRPISTLVPCMADESKTMMMTQWDKHEIEDVGLYKFDFLGLKTLTILRRTIEAVKKNRNIDIDLNTINLEDPRVFETFNKGKLSGIFQFNAPSGEQIINRIKPTCFEDIVAAEALCRPGVKERDLYISNKELLGKEGYYPVPEYWESVRDVLEETYGAIVYQEQTMLLMHNLAGWSLGKADKMRKVKNLEEYRESFVKDCCERGFNADYANDIYNRFDLGYSFNKSHAVAYAVNSMQTAYLKTYFFEEFMAATMTMELTDNEPKFVPLIKECLAANIAVIPPDINRSTGWFLPQGDGSILFPITLIKQVGDSSVEEIIAKRPFADFNDFTSRITKSKCNKRVVTNLIKCGCFDMLSGLNRSALLKTFIPDTEDVWCEELGRQYELETLGFVLTNNRLNRHAPTDFSNASSDKELNIPCILAEVKTIKDKNNKDMCFLNIETSTEFISGVMFSRSYSLYKNAMYEGLYCMLHGKKQDNSFIVNTISVL